MSIATERQEGADTPQLEAVPNGPRSQEPDQVEAVKGEVTEDRPKTKTLIWHGVDLVLPGDLPAASLFDVTEAQVGGDDTAILRMVYHLVGQEQWAKARAVAQEQSLPAEAHNELLQAVLREYGMSPGEAPASDDSSESGGGE